MLSSVYTSTLGLPPNSLLLQLVHAIHPPSLSSIGLRPENQKEWHASLDIPSSPEEQMELFTWIQEEGAQIAPHGVTIREGDNLKRITLAIQGAEALKRVRDLCGADKEARIPETPFKRLVTAPLVNVQGIEQECGPHMELCRFEVMVEVPSLRAGESAQRASTRAGRVYVEAHIHLRHDASKQSFTELTPSENR